MVWEGVGSGVWCLWDIGVKRVWRLHGYCGIGITDADRFVNDLWYLSGDFILSPVTSYISIGNKAMLVNPSSKCCPKSTPGRAIPKTDEYRAYAK